MSRRSERSDCQCLRSRKTKHSESCFTEARQLKHDLPRVRGDRVQLQQVILNLIINGLEAIAKSKDGARELSVCRSG